MRNRKKRTNAIRESELSREPIRRKEPQNDYYETVSVRLGFLQVILYLALLAFVVLSFFANTDLITYQNFYHFFRDIHASAERVDIFTATTLSYPTAEEQSFALYRKGLAVAGNNSVTVFTATGRQTVSTSVNYRNPVAVGTGKYLLVYEQGGTQYSLYSANTQMYTGKSDGPIYGAAVSESGMYALTTSSASYPSVVSLYNTRFSMINRYSKNGYVMDVAIDERGERLALLTSVPTDGGFSTRLLLAQPGESTAIAEEEVSDALGVRCAFTSAGQVAVLCTDGVRYVSSAGAVTKVMDFEGASISGASVGEDGIAVVLKKNLISKKNIVIVFDKTGKIVYNDAVGEEVASLSYVGNAVFWTTVEGVSRLWISNGSVERIEADTDRRTLLAVDEREVLLCSPQKAIYVTFS